MTDEDLCRELAERLERFKDPAASRVVIEARAARTRKGLRATNQDTVSHLSAAVDASRETVIRARVEAQRAKEIQARNAALDAYVAKARADAKGRGETVREHLLVAAAQKALPSAPPTAHDALVNEATEWASREHPMLFRSLPLWPASAAPREARETAREVASRCLSSARTTEQLARALRTDPTVGAHIGAAVRTGAGSVDQAHAIARWAMGRPAAAREAELAKTLNFYVRQARRVASR